jgi:peptidoglycan/LPS O-acetylase OafA/YrhL
MNQNESGSPQRDIPSLDGLRAISILLVVLSHVSVGVYHDYASTFTRTQSIIQVLFLLGHLGVTVFFVISGFLITTLLLKDEAIGLGRFYFRRTLRIFPPYYFYLGVILLLGVAGAISIDRGNTIAAFTYTRNYFFNESAPDAWFLAHTWSLCVEEQFYLIFPVTLVLLGKRWGFRVVALVVLLCPLLRYLYVIDDPTISIEFGRFETVADALAIGCLLARTRAWLHARTWYKGLITSNLLLATPFIALMITWLGHFPDYYPKPVYVIVLLSVRNISIALFLDWAVTNYQGRVGQFLNARPIAYIGVISYSIYLWQQPFLNPELSLPIVVKLSLMIAASLFSFYVIERPALRLRKYFESRGRTPDRSEAVGEDPRRPSEVFSERI